jgi:hypothetical protein
MWPFALQRKIMNCEKDIPVCKYKVQGVLQSNNTYATIQLTENFFLLMRKQEIKTIHESLSLVYKGELALERPHALETGAYHSLCLDQYHSLETATHAGFVAPRTHDFFQTILPGCHCYTATAAAVAAAYVQSDKETIGVRDDMGESAFFRTKTAGL